ncbi:hypothetical protein TcasGA2_TC033544 [Tribolium castaneum]|nr:hypothetical protein TcasGA2_TC033544 [Tribolium castaneum]
MIVFLFIVGVALVVSSPTGEEPKSDSSSALPGSVNNNGNVGVNAGASGQPVRYGQQDQAKTKV